MNRQIEIAIQSLTARLEKDVDSTLLCLALPFVLRIAFRVADEIYPFFSAASLQLLYSNAQKTLELVIDDSMSAEDCRNDMLYKAVVLYLNKLQAESTVQMQNSKAYFVAQDDTAKNLKDEEFNKRYVYRGDETRVDSGNSKWSFLKKFDITSMPVENTWILIRPGLHYQVYNKSIPVPRNTGNQYGGGGGEGEPISKVVANLRFSASNPDGAKVIDAFLQEALDWHIASLACIKDDATRYYHIALVSKAEGRDKDASPFGGPGSGGGGRGGGRGGGGGFGSRGSSSNSSPSYVRYPLSDSKKFSNLFFPEKKPLLDLVDSFLNKTNKYAIDGYPNKLGLLLFGEPGTGKTSLIKALAHYTKRHIVSINLSQVKTNQELMDMVFATTYNITNSDYPTTMHFKDIVFVMEDVDAASKVVLRRKHITAIDKNNTSGSNKGDFLMPETSSTRSMNTTSTKGENERDAGGADGDDKDDDGKKASMGRKGGNNNRGGSNDDKEDTNEVNATLNLLSKIAGSSDGKSSLNERDQQPDALNLSGLLNVLDGIVDTPDRILVMTTNFPDSLDAALIRPGRIDKLIYMGLMKAPEAAQLITHYFPTESLTDVHMSRLEVILGKEKHTWGTLKEKATPAYIEQKCAEMFTIDDLLTSLEVADILTPDDNDDQNDAIALASSPSSLPSLSTSQLTALGTNMNGGGSKGGGPVPPPALGLTRASTIPNSLSMPSPAIRSKSLSILQRQMSILSPKSVDTIALARGVVLPHRQFSMSPVGQDKDKNKGWEKEPSTM